MFVLNPLLSLFVRTWVLLFQAAPPTPSPIPATIVSPKSFWPETLVECGEAVSAFAIIIGGIWMLRTYREGQRLKAAETLLSMEQEFRIILPTYLLIENSEVYEVKLKPLLQAVMTDSTLSDEQLKLLADLDRCLRFLFICSVLNRDLAVEENALIRAYYYYVGLVAEMTDTNSTKHPDLSTYVEKYYPTLCRWTNDNRAFLKAYRLGKRWKPKRFWKFWDRFRPANAVVHTPQAQTGEDE